MDKQTSFIHVKDSSRDMDTLWEICLHNTKYSTATKMLTRIQSIAYAFIWGNKQDVAWEDHALPRLEEGLSLRNFIEVQLENK